MTNVVFAGVFGTVTIAAWVLAGAYPKVSTGDYVMAGHLQTAGGALVFVTATLGWYMVVSCFYRAPLTFIPPAHMP
jgi:hypothetical protein